MTRKNTFLVAGAVLIILVGAILAYLIVTNPEMLTRVPTEQGISVEEEGTVSEPEEEGEIPIINYFPGVLSRMGEKIGDCLILSEENCASAFILHDLDGNRTYGVGFYLPNREITLYSPADGYIGYSSSNEGRGRLVVSIGGPWEPADTMEKLNDPSRRKAFLFMGYGIELLIPSGSEVNKGQKIAIINSSKTVYNDFIKEQATLVFETEAEYDADIIRSEDPVEYLNQLFQLIETQ